MRAGAAPAETRVLAALLGAALLAWSGPGAPQEASAEPAEEAPRDPPSLPDEAEYDESQIEEIIVRGSRWRRRRAEPETEWRQVRPVIEAPRVRMRLGYDAEEELELRRDNPLNEFDTRTGVEPATVIRFRF